ncbi:MAG: FeoC-like transcriptional regulator [Desulfurivibrio sp.]|nr:FeoC-like transcriptional regulator [Desulfurivibrio sp.]
MLTAIKDYLKQHRRASLHDLALHFDTEPEAMRAMLARWTAKGKVSLLTPAADCGGKCGGGGCCDAGPAAEIYQWHG